MRTEVNNITFRYEFFEIEERLDAGELSPDLKAILLSEFGATSLDTVESL